MMAKFSGPLALAVVVIYGAAAAPAQSTRLTDLGAGKLLVASSGLSDPNFVETVVLLVQYDHQGTVGLIINRRTKAPISRVLQDLNAAKQRLDPVYMGGPVQMTEVLALLRSHRKPEEATSILADVYLVSSKALLEKTLAGGSGPSDFRVYLGYCGWGAGQLENEVRMGGWWIFAGNAGLVFDPDPGSVWSRLIARTEQRLARVRKATPGSELRNSGAVRFPSGHADAERSAIDPFLVQWEFSGDKKS